jgi:hypothetical protein
VSKESCRFDIVTIQSCGFNEKFTTAPNGAGDAPGCGTNKGEGDRACVGPGDGGSDEQGVDENTDVRRPVSPAEALERRGKGNQKGCAPGLGRVELVLTKKRADDLGLLRRRTCPTSKAVECGSERLEPTQRRLPLLCALEGGGVLGELGE